MSNTDAVAYTKRARNASHGENGKVSRLYLEVLLTETKR